MKKEKRVWQEPLIMNLGALPEALGHCDAGSTQTLDGTCANGQDTGSNAACVSGYSATSTCGTGTNVGASSHACANGGIPK